MTINQRLLSLVCIAGFAAACSPDNPNAADAGKGDAPTTPSVRVGSKPPPLDENNIANIAMRSKDHTTLVAALQAADYVTSVAASGPLTVFAPTNAAFDKIPAETLSSLMKPENQADLKEIIKYHATTSVYEQSWLKDGQQIAMANGLKATIRVADGKVKVNDANVVTSIRGSNGIVHVIDAVLLPPKK